ncbi:KAP family P-loop NTPase fold protein [Mesorhizobium kowhaii]
MEDNHRTLDADRAIRSSGDDRFGFTDIAKKLALSVVSASARQGMVITVEGKWGSGKSSLVNLLKQEIDDDTSNNTTVVSFSPWLIGDQDDLVVALVSAIADACEKIEGEQLAPEPKTWRDGFRQRASDAKDKAPKLAYELRSFGVAAGRKIAPILSLAGLFVLGVGMAGGAIEKGADLLETWASDENLDERKASLSSQLAKLPHRFVVLIDDLDRLEPAQAVEVIRLVRSVADFPNVIYILCHDKGILAHAIENVLRVADGAAYLQKIIQVSFNIPRPESFDLRQWLQEELISLYEKETGHQQDRNTLDDLLAAVGTVGILLQTPRDVKMVVNSIKFHFPPVKDDIYYPDLCWLHMRKILHPELYEWIETYLPDWALISQGYARPTSDESKGLADQLARILDREDVDSLRSIWSLIGYIPGVERNLQNNRTDLFREIPNSEMQNLERQRRLGSPSHYRFYFAFASPRTSFTESELNYIIDIADSSINDFEDEIVRLSEKSRATGGSWFDYFIDRVNHQTIQEWDGKRLSIFSQAIANVMDIVAESELSARTFGRLSVAYRASELVYRMLKILRDKDTALFTETLKKILEDGSSIGWLAEEFVSSEMRRHGKIGDRPKPENEWSLTDAEVESARTIILLRLQKPEEREKLAQITDLASTLFRWRELDQGSFEEPQKWFAEQIKSDQNFISLLNKMRGRVSSTEGTFFPLARRDVSPFTDWEDVKSRLHKIAGNSVVDPALSTQAKDLLADIQERG